MMTGGMDRGWKNSYEISPNCPRCGSWNTKFCYYNNYSLTQPRYFCKACRRYWTKGGSLRNVPVGGGCRKTRRHTNKTLRLHSSSSSSSSALPTPPIIGADHHAHPSATSVVVSDHHLAPHIDLALIYSNFVNQNTDLDDHPCVEYPTLSDLVFGLSEPAMIGSHFNIAEDHHHHHHNFGTTKERISGGSGDFELPPLPGEELLGSEYDIMTTWSESKDEVASSSLGTQPYVSGNWGPFHYTTNVSFPSL